jgi:hypothetical protein
LNGYARSRQNLWEYLGRFAYYCARHRGFYSIDLEITAFPPDIGFSHAADECVARFKASPLHSLDIAEVALTMC